MSNLAARPPAATTRPLQVPALVLVAAACLPVAASAGDAVRGAVLAAPCASCHGTDGHSPGEIPSIAGMTPEDLSRAMLDFRSGARPATVMNRIARGYDEPEIAAIVAYFATKAQ